MSAPTRRSPTMTPSANSPLTLPAMVSRRFRKWAMNQMSETEIVCPSCLIFPIQHSGWVAPLRS